MHFKNPPIIEAWIGFCFSFSEEEPFLLREDSASPLIANSPTDFLKPELLLSREFQVEGFDTAASPRLTTSEPVLELIRVFRKDGARCLQLRKSRLLYHWIKTAEQYPGFQALCQEAFILVDRYSSAFHPLAITSAAINYADVITLPEKLGEPFGLEKYFKLRPESPDGGFPSTRGFSMRLELPGLLAGDAQTVRFKSEFIADNQPSFRMDWQYVCGGTEHKVSPTFADRLREAHDYATKNWLACLTQTTIDLFGPLEG